MPVSLEWDILTFPNDRHFSIVEVHQYLNMTALDNLDRNSIIKTMEYKAF